MREHEKMVIAISSLSLNASFQWSFRVGFMRYRINVDWTKLEALADNKSNVAEMTISVSLCNAKENMVGKQEMFSKAFF